MAARGYSSLANVTSFLGQASLSTQQQNEVNNILPSVEDYIDLYTRRTWGQPAITNEQYDLLKDWLYLRVVPVASIQSVLVRTRAIADPGVTLTAGTDYEMQDAQRGLVVFTSGYGDPGADLALDQFTDNNNDPGPQPNLSIGESYTIPRSYALISYTPAATVPTPITRAATMLCAHWLRYNINPTAFSVQSQRDGERARVWREITPPDVSAILDRYVVPVFG